MTRFHYIVRAAGYQTRGVVGAESKRAAIDHLHSQGYDYVRVKPVRSSLRGFLSRLLTAR